MSSKLSFCRNCGILQPPGAIACENCGAPTSTADQVVVGEFDNKDAKELLRIAFGDGEPG